MRMSEVKKALIIGPKFHYFMGSIERGFQSSGYDTRVVAYDTPLHPWNFFNKLRWKFSEKENSIALSRERFSCDVLSELKDYNPSFVFVVNGDMITESCVRRLKEVAPLALWLFDSIKKYPACESVVRVADHVFCYERQDIPYIKEHYDREATFLPQAVDETLYYKVDAEKNLDIVFAGDIWQSSKRWRIVQEVVRHFGKRCSIRIWGRAALLSKTPIRYLRLKLQHPRIWKNRNATAEQLNDDYNRARVVLNIHNEQQTDGANPKVYEIAATGSYQLCDRNPYIETHFPNGEVGFYDDVTDLMDKIEVALKTNPSGERARQCVLSEDTMTARVRHILSFFR